MLLSGVVVRDWEVVAEEKLKGMMLVVDEFGR